jgi:hypothetical protein
MEDLAEKTPANWTELVAQQGLPLVRFLNATSRSVGVRDNCPFVLPSAVLQKLAFVQQILHRSASVL